MGIGGIGDGELDGGSVVAADGAGGRAFFVVWVAVWRVEQFAVFERGSVSRVSLCGRMKETVLIYVFFGCEVEREICEVDAMGG